MTDKLILHIEPTSQHAINKFLEIRQDLGSQIDKAQQSNLLIKSGGVTFRFFSKANIKNLCGLRPTHIMVDHRCELQEDEHIFLESLIRKAND